MSGKVIQTLRDSNLATALSEAELRSLAGCGRLLVYLPEETIMKFEDQEDLVYVLKKGKVALHIKIRSKKGRCEGETNLELTQPGETFGWGTWMRSDFIQTTVKALSRTSLVVLDLARLKDTGTFMNLSQRMLLALYAILQEHGLCPPSIQGILELKHYLQGKRIN